MVVDEPALSNVDGEGQFGVSVPQSRLYRVVVTEVEIFPIAIGAYRHHSPIEADAEAQQIAALLAEYGGQLVPWSTLALSSLLPRPLARDLPRPNRWREP